MGGRGLRVAAGSGQTTRVPWVPGVSAIDAAIQAGRTLVTPVSTLMLLLEKLKPREGR